MRKRHTLIIPLVFVVLMIVSAGCSRQASEDKIAYISANPGSQYENTFKELNLGVLFDFNLRLPQADKSWVVISVEGYRDGKSVEPFPLTQLAYGHSPNQVQEGQMGFGIINPTKKPQVFLYSSGVSIVPHEIERSIFEDTSMTSWGYAIDSQTIGLTSGEEKVLAVYRAADDSLRTYDYQDPDSIKQMIHDDLAVLLLKIKVEEKDGQ